MITRAFLLLFLSGVGLTVQAAKYRLNVYAGHFDSLAIGIVDFKGKGSNGHTLRSALRPENIIADDLDLCGRFHVVHRATFDSASFANEGIDLYIDGEYLFSGNRVDIACFLKGVTVKEHFLSKKRSGDSSSIRLLAHKLANDIYEIIFADRGIFESHVLFVSTKGGGRNIAVMDYDGANRRSVTRNNSVNLFPAFADSTTMLWTTYLKGTPDIYSGSTADGHGSIFVSSSGIEVSPAVSSVDGSVAYASSAAGSLDIYICDGDGSNRMRLTFSRSVETAPCWSPNGYHLAFVSDLPGHPALFIMDVDGANQRRITYKSRYCDSPSWSPKGDRIAFTSMGENGKLDIWAVSPDGSDETRLTDFPGNNTYPTWSPNGSLIGFIAHVGGKSDFYVMRPDGSRVRRITTRGDVRMPDWGK
jgi:TolB protein